MKATKANHNRWYDEIIMVTLVRLCYGSVRCHKVALQY